MQINIKLHPNYCAIKDMVSVFTETVKHNIGSEIEIVFHVHADQDKLFTSIEKVVMEEFDVDRAGLYEIDKHRNLVDARHVLYYLMHKYIPTPLAKMSHKVNRDRTTMLHGVNKIKSLIDIEDVLKTRVENCTNKLDQIYAEYRNKN